MKPATTNRPSGPKTGPLRPFTILAKPTGAQCNLDCSYCFFLSKEVLWAGKGQRMSEETLDLFLERYLSAQPDGEVVVGWQGGEPTMRGLDFFKLAVKRAEALKRPGQHLTHTIQTNGTLINDEWGEFLAANNFLVGVSIDGDAELHDAYRVNRAGRGTHAQVLRGWRVLEKHGVERNVLTTVNSVNSEHPLRVYHHLRDEVGAQYIQFIPIVERVAPGEEDLAEASWKDEQGFHLYQQTGRAVTSRSVKPEAWGRFLTEIFDEWVKTDVKTVSIQHIDTALSAMFGRYNICVHSPVCGGALALEANGEVYSCDHYVEPDYALGNLATKTFPEMLHDPKQRKFGAAKAILPTKCRECPVRYACHGGCPKDRFIPTSPGEPDLNYLCAGYQAFFTHLEPTLTQIAKRLARGLDPCTGQPESR